ncbi:MAG: OmpH family outer membrane protein [Deltaproteobacteria bacterium]|nr:OmpH family outer membrane protein [Deltaproteobacteria bacterium]
MKKATYVIGAVLLLALVSAPAAFAADAGDRVGYVSLQRIMKETKVGQEAAKLLFDADKAKAESLKPLAESVVRLKKEAEDAKSPMDARKKAADEYAQAKKDYDRALQDAREELKAKDQALAGDVYKKADDVVKKVAQKRNYSIVIKDPTVMGFLDPRVDITEEVIKEMNK